MSLSPPAGSADHIRGDLSAPVVLVQYGDFECPYSAALYGTIKEIQAQWGERLCYVFRPFPLADVHPHAQLAAQAAEAAGEKFWEMHDLLFENQDDLREGDLLEYARTLGLPQQVFGRDLHSQAIAARVAASVRSGRDNGVHGTPTLFVNGEFHDNRESLWEASRLVRVLESALAP